MRSPKLLLAGAHWPDRLLACLGAAIGIGLTGVVCGLMSALLPGGPADLPVIVAPIGASAVLVFAVPTSPLAQPWSVIGGNTLSAMVGVAAFHLVPHPAAAAAGIGVGGAILAMSLARCLHPPGGAAALTAVIGGAGIHAAGFGFALWPVDVDSGVLVALGLLFHRAARRKYPHRLAAPLPAMVPGFETADIDAALADMHESFDIAREDLDHLLLRAERHAVARRLS